MKRRNMKILASDYDGTLYENGELLGDVLGAVAKWRAAGNIFGLATGRDFSMITPEVSRWNLPVDFIVCINGAAIYDADMSLLDSHLLDDNTVSKIFSHPAVASSQHYQVSGLGPLQVLLREGSFFWDSDIAFQRIDENQARMVRDVGQISLGFPSSGESEKWANALNTDLADVIEAHQNKRMIDITRKGVDKAAGIATLLKAKQWSADNLYTVGDGGNDIAMIKTYNGYTVKNAAPSVLAVAKKQFVNVPELIDSII